MNGSRSKSYFLHGYLAVLYAALFLVGTRLVPEWGQWYSGRTYYREQTDALLKGSLALHDTPTALRLDLAWHNGGVHQVWGLGVPCWRLPFEILARACGQPAFPDRIAFGIALMLMAFFVFRILFSPAKDTGTDSAMNPLRIAATVVILFFPPFLTLCRFRFDIYEESIAYSYIVGIGLFLGLMAFTQRPTQIRFIMLSAAAGLAPLVRPTLGACGLATMLLLWFCSRKASFKWWQSMAGWLLFGLGGLLLLVTNKIRFGSALEFGHSINFNAFPLWMFNRFYGPFEHEPLWPAMRELAGWLFSPAMLNDFNWTTSGLFRGQSDTPRWRRIYLTGFGPSFAALLLASWFFWFRALRRRISVQSKFPAEAWLAGAWSMIATAMLAAFYLRTPVMTSRYVMDFNPAFAVGIAGLFFALDALLKQRGTGRVLPWLVLAAAVGWTIVESLGARARVERLPPLDRAKTLALLSSGFPPPGPLPETYRATTEPATGDIPYNCAGWDKRTGRMSTVAIFFLNNPGRLKIRVAPERRGSIDYAKIQAKIGRELLVVDSIEKADDGAVIRFRPARNPGCRKGIQVVSLAYVDKDHITVPESPLRLLEVSRE